MSIMLELIAGFTAGVLLVVIGLVIYDRIKK